MAERKTSKKIAARDRVREIKARLDAEKAERERRLYEVVTAFHEARVERDEALTAAGGHETTMAARLRDLLAMDQPLDRAATLCDLTESEARGLRRRGTRAKTGVAVEIGRRPGSVTPPNSGSEPARNHDK